MNYEEYMIWIAVAWVLAAVIASATIFGRDRESRKLQRDAKREAMHARSLQAKWERRTAELKEREEVFEAQYRDNMASLAAETERVVASRDALSKEALISIRDLFNQGTKDEN